MTATMLRVYFLHLQMFLKSMEPSVKKAWQMLWIVLRVVKEFSIYILTCANAAQKKWSPILMNNLRQFINVRTNHDCQIFTLEGLIGSGKSTLLKQLEAIDLKTQIGKNVVILQEPINEWTNTSRTCTNTSLFELYNMDPKRYAFCFQMFALETRFESLYKVLQNNRNCIVICERSILTDYEVFAKMLSELDMIDPHSMFVYKQWHDFMTRVLDLNVKGIFYLRTPIHTCVSRIKSRDRKGEENIDESYMAKLQECHENWLNNVSSTNMTALPVCNLDDKMTVDEKMNSIVAFVKANM